MVLARPRFLACSPLLLFLATLGCVPVPPEVVDLTDGTSADPTGSTSAEPSTETTPTPGTSTTDTGVVPDGTSTTSTDTTSADTTSDTETGPGCGNGIAGGDEDCDDADLADATCETLGFGGGTLACNADCTYDESGCGDLPAAPVLSLDLSQVKQFDFSWEPVADAEHYQLLESPDSVAPYVQLGDDIIGESISITMPLHFRYAASYVLSACNAFGCTDSDPVSPVESLAEAVGYFKSSSPDADDGFGFSLAISGDGNTLAVGVPGEDSTATGIGGDANNDARPNSGAVFVFVRDGAGAWSQQAYVKAAVTDNDDDFGVSVALSDDGSTLAVGADFEDGNGTGTTGNASNDSSGNSGAAYVFVRDAAGVWSQQVYVKASNTGQDDYFGADVALSGDGNTLAVGAIGEDSSATGIGGNQADGSASNSGAVYVFVRNAAAQWSQQAYVKASNTDQDDYFGFAVALSGDGNTLAVGAELEDGNATGVGGDQADDSASNAGAVYVLVRDGAGAWSQQAYVKASNTDQDDNFGFDVALSHDGDTLAVGATGEDSDAIGVGGNQGNDLAADSGAVYVLVRAAGAWSQQAYVKATNAEQDDSFGASVALSDDGSTLAVGAWEEDGGTVGLQGDEADDSAANSGAGYVLVRDGAGTWSPQAYVKAPNTDQDDSFAWSIALSGDAGTLAVGADWEDGSATGIGGDQTSNAAQDAGSVYLY